MKNIFKYNSLILLALIIRFNLTANEVTFQKLDPLPLYPTQQVDKETMDRTLKTKGIFQKVTTPALIAYLPKQSLANGTSLLICPGGGYGALAWLQHVERLAPFFTAKGIAVIGLKYRTNHPQNNIPEDPLQDFNQAIRLIRQNAKTWQLNPEKIVGLGFSAGANLLLQYACSNEYEKIKYLNFLCLWPFFKKAETYIIKRKDLDIIFFTAEDDKIAPSSFSVDIAAQFTKSGNQSLLIRHPKGNHMVYNFETYGPTVDWTTDFLKWLKQRDLL